MAIAVLGMGASGTGKSASLRNFSPDEIGVINVAGKPLPFRSEIKSFKSDRYEEIEAILKKAKVKSLVIDDSQYLMANEFMRRASENGFQKFTDIGRNFWALVDMINHDLPEDVIVYFMQHTELDANGNEKAKTIGKMLDEKLTLEGGFDIVLHARTDGQEHWFSTQSDGTDTAKSPEEMFEAKIPNDLAFVDKTIREYYGMEAI